MPFWTDPRPTVLLTGFGPFPGVRRNASAVLVKRLATCAQKALPHYRFAAAVLPTEWVAAPHLLSELYTRHDPVLALHFGVAPNMRGFRIEKEARNFCRPSPDAAGCLPVLDRVSADGAPTLASTIAAETIARHLDVHGYEAKLSDDAGGYLCNAVLYRSLVEAKARGGRCRTGFIHVASDAKRQDILDHTLPGALEILKSALESSLSETALTSV
jgi:pyroglutamyl-peptidase